MMHILATLAALTSLIASSSIPALVDVSLNSEWELYKSFHGKSYEAYEEKMRRFIWEENFKMIAVHNLEASMGKHTYTMKMNAFGDLSSEEFVEMVLGKCVLNKRNLTGKASALVKSPLVKIPSSVDWRTKGIVTPVKNQKRCGSCWAFSTTGSVEGQHALKTGNLASLSEQQLVDCSGEFGNQGCNGGLMDNAFEYIKSCGGIETEKSYPYKAKDGQCKFKKSLVAAKVTGHTDVEEGDEDSLTYAIADVGPVSVAIDASQSSFRFYSDGVYYDDDCSSSSLDHGVLAVGYGTDQGQDYYLVKNSWDTTWGLNGYIKMSRNRDNNCGIASQASYPLV